MRSSLPGLSNLPVRKLIPPMKTTLALILLLAITSGLEAQFPSPSQAAPSTAATPSGPATLSLDLSKPGPAVSPMLYGLMTEEINHSYDGGLYAELIQNRIFKDNSNTPTHWTVINTGGAAATIALDKSD